jgi:hypothetical protein
VKIFGIILDPDIVEWLIVDWSSGCKYGFIPYLQNKKSYFHSKL